MGVSRVSPTHRWQRVWPETNADKDYHWWWGKRYVMVRYRKRVDGYHLINEHATGGHCGFLLKQIPTHNPDQETYMVFFRDWAPSVLIEIDWRDRAPQ